MSSKLLLVGIVSFFIGIVLTISTLQLAIDSNNSSLIKFIGIDTKKLNNSATPSQKHHANMSMNEMTESLVGKNGDALDKAFIEAMIPHHQGAIDMAHLVAHDAKHRELRTLAEEIIVAQTKEIQLMRGWLTEWGYTTKNN